MFTKIVVGYDGYSRSTEAVNAAAELARSLSASLHVVTAVAKDRFRDLDGGVERRAVDLEEARTTVDKLVSEIDGIKVTSTAQKGSPGEVLLAEAEHLGADLIVVGNKNVQGVGRVLGSVASDVTHKASCAVLIINTRHIH